LPTFKISQLTTAVAVSATNQFEINQNAASRSLEVSVLSSYVRGLDTLVPVNVSVSSATAAVSITQTGTGPGINVLGGVRFRGATAGFVGLVAPVSVSSVTYTLPAADGTNGQVLTTNGTNILSFTSVGGASLTGITQSTTPFETALGFEAGLNTTGVNNTLIGYRAGKANTTGTDNTVVGWQAYASGTTGIANSVFGRSAGAVMTTAGYNSAFGSNSYGGTTGILNSAFGWNSLNQATTAYENTGMGARALQQITTGHSNTAAGYGAIENLNTANNNVAVGHSAGSSVGNGNQNTLIGAKAGASGTNDLTTGSNNTIIGYEAAATSATVSNEITLGNSSITNFRVPGVGLQFDTTSGLTVPKTITAGGTTGARTINKTAGTVNFAAAATSLVVTNSFVSTSSVIIATVGTNDSTMKSVAVVAGAGSFTLHANASATAETRVNWVVIN
jgi:hypothetical protein